ncbi:hypothetical protein HOY82DRAFT_79677 [Tuber indicum]|nr:hypothetical protein HOY82DRAFT_79677 [Tuber indicum]
MIRHSSRRKWDNANIACFFSFSFLFFFFISSPLGYSPYSPGHDGSYGGGGRRRKEEEKKLHRVNSRLVYSSFFFFFPPSIRGWIVGQSR